MSLRPTQAEEITALEASVDNLSRLLDAATDRIHTLEADAEVGRLLREAVASAAPGHQFALSKWDGRPGGVPWCAEIEEDDAYGDTPAEALRALLEGGQHDAG